MNEQDKYKEITLQTTPIYSGKIISLQVDQVQLPNGKTASREIVRHPGAVAVLAIYDSKMIVVEQFRKAVEASMIEIPAGKLEPGEDLAEAAKRELEEETGYTCSRIYPIASFVTSPGFADEILHLFAAENLQPGRANPDEDEFLDVSLITLDEALQYIAEGKIRDAKTMMAVYAWRLYQLTGKM